MSHNVDRSRPNPDPAVSNARATATKRPSFGLRPSRLPPAPSRSIVSIPTVDDQGGTVDQPAAADAGAAPAGPAPGPTPAGACGIPSSISKVTSGTFAGGKTMDDYYPDLVGMGYYAHPGTGGPFDTGTRAGSNVQIVATISPLCPSASFSLAQTVTYTRRIWDGVHDPLEGRTFDDVAKSGRDASRAPFRQEWAGPAAFVSMADPPSIDYSPYTSAEVDRDFKSSLVGPAGRVDVSWSTSIRIAGGRVSSNTVT